MTKIIDKINALPQETRFFSLEFFPPKTTAGFQNLLPRLNRLRLLQPLFVLVTFNAGGTTADKSLQLADICQNQQNLTTCLHLTCTNLKRSIIDNVLEECKRIGIRNILALRGDEPREGEYAAANEQTNGHHNESGDGEDGAEDVRFTYAVDLIRYIKRKHGSHFCIGAATYPEGHPNVSSSHPGAIHQSPEQDLTYLAEKVKAGADFLVTQLFYDVDKYLAFEHLVKNDTSGVFDGVPIIPGLMPVQGWQSFTRTCKLARIGLPDKIRERLYAFKGDDEALKNEGVEVLSEIIEKIKSEGIPVTSDTSKSQQNETTRPLPRGFHFFTLNLEKAVAQILERCNILSITQEAHTNGRQSGTDDTEDALVVVDGLSNGDLVIPRENKHRTSSVHNRVVVSEVSAPIQYEALEGEAGLPHDASNDEKDALAIAEGEGSLGREATWDDFPNGRWGDARSPAYDSINIYSLHPQLAPSSALPLWRHPTSSSDISSIFRKYLTGELSANPWSEEALSPETDVIKAQLLALNEKGWWTVASQPAVNACSSGDEIFGWGPRTGGWVWQKPFVEFFVPSRDWAGLRERLSERASQDELTFFAGNAAGEFQASDEKSVNAVTWGAFKGKEIITPTIIEPTSFLAWRDEAFIIWREWAQVFPPLSQSARLLENLREECWLVNVIGHDYMNNERLWDILLE